MKSSDDNPMLRLAVLHEEFDQARARMITEKPPEGAIAYCGASSEMSGAVLPPLKLVHPCRN